MALGAALLLSLEAIVGKRGLTEGATPLVGALIASMVATCLLWSTMAFRIVIIGDRAFGTFEFLVFFLSGISGSGLGILGIYHGIHRVGASINVSVINSRPLFVAVLAYIFLGELVSLFTVLGIVLLVSGIIVISFSKGGDVCGWKRIELLFPIGAAIAISVGNLIRRYGLTHTEILLIEALAINALGGTLTLASYILITHRTEELVISRRAYGYFIIGGLSMLGGIVLIFAALAVERVAIVESFLATSPLFALLLTLIMLRDLERVTIWMVLGTMLIIVGGIFIVAV